MRNILEKLFFLSMSMVVFAALYACGNKSPEPEKTAEAQQSVEKTEKTTPKPSVSSSGGTSLENATIMGVFTQPIVLSEGEWTGSPIVPGAETRPTAHLVEDLAPRGDLDGDGIEDLVALLVVDEGGSGSSLYLVPMSPTEDGFKQLGIAQVGDRVMVQSASVKDGSIVLHTIEQGPDDAACCPTQKKKRIWQLEKGALNETMSLDDGALSLDDIAGRQWLLVGLSRNRAVSRKLGITLELAPDSAILTGFGGCNHYTLPVESPGPGLLIVEGNSSARKKCDPEIFSIETEFLNSLEHSAGFGFSYGKLALDYQNGDWTGTLLFKPVE